MQSLRGILSQLICLLIRSWKEEKSPTAQNWSKDQLPSQAAAVPIVYTEAAISAIRAAKCTPITPRNLLLSGNIFNQHRTSSIYVPLNMKSDSMNKSNIVDKENIKHTLFFLLKSVCFVHLLCLSTEYRIVLQAKFKSLTLNSHTVFTEAEGLFTGYAGGIKTFFDPQFWFLYLHQLIQFFFQLLLDHFSLTPLEHGIKKS